MHLVLRFVLAALAVWRLSYLLARQDGPFRVFAGMRAAAGGGFFSRLLGCVKCVSVWIAIPFAFFVGGSATELLVCWLALSGVASLIDECTRPPFEWREEPGDDLLRTSDQRHDD